MRKHDILERTGEMGILYSYWILFVIVVVNLLLLTKQFMFGLKTRN